MSPRRAFKNHDHLKPPHEDNPADNRIKDYRSRPDVTRELPDEPDNYQMSLVTSLHIPRKGRHIPRRGRSSYPPEGWSSSIPRRGCLDDCTLFFSQLTHCSLTSLQPSIPCGRDPWRRAHQTYMIVGLRRVRGHAIPLLGI